MLKQLDLYVKKKLNLDLYLKPCIKINSKHVTDLCIRVQMIKLTKEDTEHVCDLGPAKGSLDKTQKAWFIKERNDNPDVIKTKLLFFKRSHKETEKTNLRLIKYMQVIYLIKNFYLEGFPGGTAVENLPANAGDTGSSPGLGGSHMPRSNWAREPQLLSLCVWGLCSATREAAIVRGPCTSMKSGPRLPQLEKALAQKRRPNTAIN